jgi:hypothetical protein
MFEGCGTGTNVVDLIFSGRLPSRSEVALLNFLEAVTLLEISFKNSTAVLAPPSQRPKMLR